MTDSDRSIPPRPGAGFLDPATTGARYRRDLFLRDLRNIRESEMVASARRPADHSVSPAALIATIWATAVVLWSAAFCVWWFA